MTESDRPLTDALHRVIRQRAATQGLSLNAVARSAGILSSTLSRQMRGAGTLTPDEYDAIAIAVGAQGVEELLAEARG